MKKNHLNNFTKGWVVGDFEPALLKNKEVEFGIHKYRLGDKEAAHRHNIAKEYTIIGQGFFRMNEEFLKEGDIVLVEPGETVDFECLADGFTVIIKTPSVVGDKYLAADPAATTDQQPLTAYENRPLPVEPVFMANNPPVTDKVLKIVVPMAGAGKRFQEAGYTFPKPLIDVNGKPMIQLVIENLKPDCPHKFIFICQREHYEKYSLNEIFNNTVGRDNYECVHLSAQTQGAACTVMTAANYLNNDDDLIIANSDQLIDIRFDDFINAARASQADGLIMSFESSHPKWSYARLDNSGNVLEVAEKKVISNKATVGIYYFKEGRQFVEAAQKMIAKDIRVNNEFYVCPTYNELIIDGKIIKIWDIKQEQMHGLGTPEDLQKYLSFLEKDKRQPQSGLL
jgi:dTDP-glucose pyrophosphorylase